MRPTPDPEKEKLRAELADEVAAFEARNKAEQIPAGTMVSPAVDSDYLRKYVIRADRKKGVK